MRYHIRELRDVEIPLHQSSVSLKEVLEICERNGVKNFEGVVLCADTEYDYDNAYSSLVLKIKNQPA
jgi:hypothetical protein